MKKIVGVISILLLIVALAFGLFYKTKIKKYVLQKYADLTKKYVFVDRENLEVQVPVLTYHYIADYNTDVTTLNDGTIISADAFESQMKWLFENGYKSLTMQEFMDWKNGKRKINNKRFLVTFDDGFTSTYNLAEPILKKYNFTAVQFVINELLNEKTPTFSEQRYAYMGYDYVNGYLRDIIEIGSHTYHMHHQLPKVYAKINSMTYDEILDDFKKSKEELNTKYISYPYGAITDDGVKAAKDAGYDCGFILNGSMTYQEEDNYRISRISAMESLEVFKGIFETDKYRKKSTKLF